MRPYDEVVHEIQALWREGVLKLEAALAVAQEQGFIEDTHELGWGISNVEGKATRFHSQPDPYDRLRALVRRLELSNHGEPAHLREVWILCPRAHAEQHGFRIPPPRVSTSVGRELFRMVDRFRDGEDLVYAIAPGQ